MNKKSIMDFLSFDEKQINHLLKIMKIALL